MPNPVLNKLETIYTDNSYNLQTYQSKQPSKRLTLKILRVHTLILLLLVGLVGSNLLIPIANAYANTAFNGLKAGSVLSAAMIPPPNISASAALSATTIIVKSGPPTNMFADSVLTDSFQAIVKDAQGKPVSGTTVIFTGPPVDTIPVPGGYFLRESDGYYASLVFTATSDAQGLVSVGDFRANDLLGSYSITATIPGVSNSSAVWNLNNQPGGPTEPATPEGLTATAQDGQVTLSWHPNPTIITTSAVITAYHIYRVDGSNMTMTIFTKTAPPPSVTTITYTDTSLVNGTTYNYMVTAVNNVGDSGFAPPVEVIPNLTNGAPTISPLMLSVTQFSDHTIINWDSQLYEPNSVMGYNVYRQDPNNSANWFKINTNVVTDTTYIDILAPRTDNTPVVPYTYRVTNVNKKGESIPSEPYTANLIGVSQPIPTTVVPTNLNTIGTSVGTGVTLIIHKMTLALGGHKK
jgi:hypothetical protein